jgi:hypothetical protein
LLQHSPNLLTKSHCRSDFLLPCHKLTTDGAGMTRESFINDPEYWRTRAEEARMLAKNMNDSASKDAMLRIADDYEQLAQRGEEWALRRLPKN